MLRNFATAVKGMPYFALEAGTRSGTTLLSRLLDSHPNIVSTGEAHITADTTIEGDSVTTVVSKEAYIGMQPRRQGVATWMDPKTLELVQTGRIILTRSLLETIYSTYKLIVKNGQDGPRMRLLRAPVEVTDERKLLRAINGVIQARRELLLTVSTGNSYVVDYQDILDDPILACNGIFSYMGLPEYIASLAPSKISTPTRGDKSAHDQTKVGRINTVPDAFKQRVNSALRYDIDTLNTNLHIIRGHHE